MNSKNKGSQFEREVARKLGKALYDDEDALWRTHSSGGWVKEKTGRVHPGDIYPIKPVPFPFEFVIECKNVKSWSLDDFFKDKNNLIIQWWNKLLDDRSLAGETYKNYTPLLIVTKNYYPILAISNMVNIIPPPQWAIFHFNTVDSLVIIPFETLTDELKRSRVSSI